MRLTAASGTVAWTADEVEHCAMLAEAHLWWEPGTHFGYYAKTFGFLLGETMRRTTGRPISTLLRDLITGPLGVEDEVPFAVPLALLPRVARQVASDAEPPALESV